MARTQDFYSEGEQSLASGQIETALEKFERGFEETEDVRCAKRLGFMHDFGYNSENRPDPQKGALWYERAAAMGDSEAQAILGMRYFDGFGVKQDYDKAFELLQKGESACNSVALRYLGLCYQNGLGVSEDKGKAVSLFEVARKYGDPHACYLLGSCLQNGEGTDKDEPKAFECYMEGALKDDTASQGMVGACYAEGLCGVDVDYDKAAEWTKKAADKDCGPSQYIYGRFLANGLGVEKDEKEAVTWLTKASLKGVADAQYALGKACETGRGVEQNFSMAEMWYIKAARGGNVMAMNNLAVLYYDGYDGVAKDERKAFLCWYAAATKYGDARSMMSLAFCYRDGTGIEKDTEKARRWLYAAADKGDAISQFNIAVACIKGEFGDPDNEKGIEYLKKSAGQGFENAALLLGLAYLLGEIVEPDADLAVIWLGKAADADNIRAMFTLASVLETGEAGYTDTARAMALYRRILDKYSSDTSEDETRDIVAKSYYRLAAITEIPKKDFIGVVKEKRDFYLAAKSLGYECDSEIASLENIIALASGVELVERDPLYVIATRLKSGKISEGEAITGIEEILRERFGVTWDDMGETVKKSLISGLFSHARDMLMETNAHDCLDGSALVLHSVKALEISLRGVFSQKIVSYLKKKHITAYDYVNNNGNSRGKCADSPVVKKKRNGNFVYNKKVVFTLGSISHIAGMDKQFYFTWVKGLNGMTATAAQNNRKARVPEPMNGYILDYLDEEVFKDDAFPGANRRDDIIAYMYRLAGDVSDIAKTSRNPGVHNESISWDDAVQCEQRIVSKGGLLPDFVSKLNPGYIS